VPPTAEREFRGSARFQLTRRLGAGGMGVVWEAMDRERLTPVALKTLRTLAPEALYRFKHEFRALQDLSHPNLVSLGELIEENGHWFFTMELVRGVNLLRWVRPEDELSESEAVRTATESQPSLAGADESVTVPAIPSRVRAAPATTINSFDEPRLRSAFAQLAEGVATLHVRGLVHRDLKPSNVLVTPDGRVVILDFGVVAALSDGAGSGAGARARQELRAGSGAGQPLSDADEHGRVVGTAAYMAPEQAAGTAIGAAADWYAVGIVLYQALTGRLPFYGRRAEILAWKAQREPTPPRELDGNVPADLDALCRDLLRIDPAARPDDAEVLRRLGATAPTVMPRRAGFVGRAAELGALARAADDARRRGITTLVAGDSGVGKSALVRHFLDELLAHLPETLVLSSRCYERESVHFKAVDGAIDALMRWLASLWPDEVQALLPREVPLLAELFPVLHRVDAIAAAPPLPNRPEDPQELRTRAFVALRQLLGAIAARRPLVLAIDDLQWADNDSLALIGELMRPPDEPRLLLLATMRAVENAAGQARLRVLADRVGGELRLVELKPLDPPDARELAAELLGRDDAEGPLSAAVIATEAHGHPLFIDELVRHRLVHGASLANPPLQLDEALQARIAQLDVDGRRVLELTAVAGAPTQQGTMAAAAALDFSAFSRVTSKLRAESLVRTSGVHAQDTIEPYHDRVREAVLRHLDLGARTMRHGRLALALEASKQADAQALALHFAEAGDRERAARYTTAAADGAQEALAFDRAVTLYREALAFAPAGGESARALAVKVGEALANAGRGGEAGRAFLDAAEAFEQPLPPAPLGVKRAAIDGPSMALELRRRAAEQLLRGGHVDDGLQTVRSVLHAIGMSMPESPTGALASLLCNRARVRLRGLGFRPRPAAEVAPEILQQLDTCLSIAVGMGLVDTIRGADFQTRALLLALRAGEPHRVARALAMEAAHSAAGGGKTRARTARLLAAAAAVAKDSDSPELQAYIFATRGIAAFLEGRWRECKSDCSQAEALFRDRCIGASWEADSAQSFGLWALFYLGELKELVRRLPHAIRDAEERGDLYAATNLRIGELNFVHLVRDDVAAARRAAGEAMRAWSRQGFHHQHWDNLLAEGTTDLYEGKAAQAYERVQRTWKPLERSLLLMIQLTRVEAVHLRGRAALALAVAKTGSERARLLAEAAAQARRLRRERLAWATPLAALLDGGVARARGRDGDAQTFLCEAVAGFASSEMSAWAAGTQLLLGRMVGGDGGKTLVAEAEALLRAQLVIDPWRLAATLAPGYG
jgi:serine/threonine protein kinase